MTIKRLDFLDWLEIANHKQYKRYLENPKKVPIKFRRAYIEYLHNFRCGLTKVVKIKDETNFNLIQTKIKRGNTLSRKHISFLTT